MQTESARPIAIRDIDHVVLRVRDVARMLHFYGEVLGCVEVRRQDDIGLVQLRAGSAMLDLVPVEARFGAEGEGPSIYLRDPEGNTIELKGPPSA
jgi:glyoxylase I family protein